MAGTWLVNVIFGTSAFLFTFFFSIINNTWKTSAFRGAMGFILFFFLSYLLRLVLNPKQVRATPITSNNVEGNLEKEHNNTPMELEYVEDTSFQAISLGSLHNELESKNPEIIVDTIRKLAWQNQEG